MSNNQEDPAVEPHIPVDVDPITASNPVETLTLFPLVPVNSSQGLVDSQTHHAKVPPLVPANAAPGLGDPTPSSNPLETLILFPLVSASAAPGPGDNQPHPAEVPPLIRHAQYFGRTEEGCSLFGCSHVVSEVGSRYCSVTHQNMAAEVSSLGKAYVVVDGFFGEFKDKDVRSVVCLLKRYEQGTDVGIPLIDDETTFSTLPWELDFIDLNMLEREASRSWLFFHSQTNPIMRCFDYNGAKVRWGNKNYYLHSYRRSDDEDFVEIASMVSYLRQPSGKKTDEPMEEYVDDWIRGWSLTEYVYHFHSLFCLTFTSPSLLFNTSRVVLKDNPDYGKKIDKKRKGEDFDKGGQKEPKLLKGGMNFSGLGGSGSIATGLVLGHKEGINVFGRGGSVACVANGHEDGINASGGCGGSVLEGDAQKS